MHIKEDEVPHTAITTQATTYSFRGTSNHLSYYITTVQPRDAF